MKKEGTLSVCKGCNSSYYAPPSHREKRSYCSRNCRALAQSLWQKKDLNERFWQKVDKTGSCWIWTGAKLKTGYGSIRINNRSKRAHRVAYELSIGSIPEDGLILHSCDTKLCVNPDHLRVGTKSENTKDAIERGQHKIGENSVKAKLSNIDVAIIRASLEAGISGKVLADKFNVCEATISKIKIGNGRIHG